MINFSIVFSACPHTVQLQKTESHTKEAYHTGYFPTAEMKHYTLLFEFA